MVICHGIHNWDPSHLSAPARVRIPSSGLPPIAKPGALGGWAMVALHYIPGAYTYIAKKTTVVRAVRTSDHRHAQVHSEVTYIRTRVFFLMVCSYLPL